MQEKKGKPQQTQALNSKAHVGESTPHTNRHTACSSGQAVQAAPTKDQKHLWTTQD
jgi:hypothetical protein